MLIQLNDYPACGNRVSSPPRLCPHTHAVTLRSKDLPFDKRVILLTNARRDG